MQIKADSEIPNVCTARTQPLCFHNHQPFLIEVSRVKFFSPGIQISSRIKRQHRIRNRRHVHFKPNFLKLSAWCNVEEMFFLTGEKVSLRRSSLIENKRLLTNIVFGSFAL